MHAVLWQAYQEAPYIYLLLLLAFTMKSFFFRLVLCAGLFGASLSANAIVFRDNFNVAQTAEAFNTNNAAFGDVVTDTFSPTATRSIYSYNSSNSSPGGAG